MKIKINGNLLTEVSEDYLIVKDNKLYNTNTKQYEGVDGDIVEFITETNGIRLWHRGYVNGYTCGDKIPMRGHDKESYERVMFKAIENISRCTYEDGMSFEEKELLAATEEL